MARSILSPDILSIGLLLSEGNINITMEDLAGKVNVWQTRNNRIFGVTDNDYLNSLLKLVLLDLNFIIDIVDFCKITLYEMIPKILKYNEVYFNDEGEHWLEPVEYEDAGLAHFFGLDRKGYEAKMYTKAAMQLFFENCNSDLIDSSQINDFLMEQGITEQILTDCSDYSKVITGEWFTIRW